MGPGAGAIAPSDGPSWAGLSWPSTTLPAAGKAWMASPGGHQRFSFCPRTRRIVILRLDPTVVRHFRNDRLNLINGLDGIRRRLARKHTRLLNRPRNVRAVLQGRSPDLRASTRRHPFRR